MENLDRRDRQWRRGSDSDRTGGGRSLTESAAVERVTDLRAEGYTDEQLAKYGLTPPRSIVEDLPFSWDVGINGDGNFTGGSLDGNEILGVTVYAPEPLSGTVNVSSRDSSWSETKTIDWGYAGSDNVSVPMNFDLPVESGVQYVITAAISDPEVDQIQVDYNVTSLSTGSGGSDGGDTEEEPPKPDMELDSGSLRSSEIWDTEQGRFSADISNSGDADGEISVSLYSNGSRLVRQNYSVSAGSSRTVSLDIPKLESGRYQMELRSSAGDTVSLGEFVVKPSAANLVIDGGFVSSPNAYEGQEFTVGVGVKNTGKKRGSEGVTVLADGNEVASKSMTVEPGETDLLRVPTTMAEEGTYPITAMIGDMQVETDIGSISIVPMEDAIVVSGGRMSDTRVYQHEPFTLSVEVTNNGEKKSSRTFTVRREGERVGEVSASPAPGETATVEAEMSLADPGMATLTSMNVNLGTIEVADIVDSGGVTIDGCASDRNEVASGGAATVTYDVVNHTSVPLRAGVSATANDEFYDEFTVRLPAGESGNVEVRYGSSTIMRRFDGYVIPALVLDSVTPV